jgi:hypothetical protein
MGLGSGDSRLDQYNPGLEDWGEIRRDLGKLCATAAMKQWDKH